MIGDRVWDQRSTLHCRATRSRWDLASWIRLRSSGQLQVCPVFHAIDHRFQPMLVKTHDHVLAANDHRHAARTRNSDHFIQSGAVFADIKLNVFGSLSRKELLRLVTVVASREAVNLDLFHSRFLLEFISEVLMMRRGPSDGGLARVMAGSRMEMFAGIGASGSGAEDFC